MAHQLLKNNHKNHRESYTTGFQEFLPIYSTCDDYEYEEDEDEIDSQEDDEDDYDEFNYKFKQEIDSLVFLFSLNYLINFILFKSYVYIYILNLSNPMDMFNHETFSDMQSISKNKIRFL